MRRLLDTVESRRGPALVEDPNARPQERQLKTCLVFAQKWCNLNQSEMVVFQFCF